MPPDDRKAPTIRHDAGDKGDDGSGGESAAGFRARASTASEPAGDEGRRRLMTANSGDVVRRSAIDEADGGGGRAEGGEEAPPEDGADGGEGLSRCARTSIAEDEAPTRDRARTASSRSRDR